MVRRGARHLLLLSRSGATKPAAIQLLNELKGEGVEVWAPACDITDAEALASVLSQSARSMPPIKGCIQAAMVLKVGQFYSCPVTI
jgi:NAD(P)-dependent dehydrogenase (short-subunit alcohol dehydrogenase family)